MKYRSFVKTNIFDYPHTCENNIFLCDTENILKYYKAQIHIPLALKPKADSFLFYFKHVD